MVGSGATEFGLQLLIAETVWAVGATVVVVTILLGMGLVFIGFGLAFAYKPLRNLVYRLRSLETIEGQPGDVEPGAYATVTGTAQPIGSETLVPPLGSSAAIAYRYQIDQESSDVGWWTVADGGNAVSFEVEGPTDRIRVEPEETSPAIELTEQVSVGADESLTTDVETRLKNSEIFDLERTPQVLASAVDEPRTYETGTITPGDTVAVHGMVEPDQTGGKRVTTAGSHRFVLSEGAEIDQEFSDQRTRQVSIGRLIGGLFFAGAGLFPFGFGIGILWTAISDALLVAHGTGCALSGVIL